jgi:hypothetical protein
VQGDKNLSSEETSSCKVLTYLYYVLELKDETFCSEGNGNWCYRERLIEVKGYDLLQVPHTQNIQNFKNRYRDFIRRFREIDFGASLQKVVPYFNDQGIEYFIGEHFFTVLKKSHIN